MELLFHAFVLLAIIAFAALSRRLESSIVTMPMFFTAVGWLLGAGGARLVPMDAAHAVIRTLAELTLIVLLFADASRINLMSLEKHAGIPARMLLIGMPLTVLLGAAVAHWVSPDQPWALALLLAAILTPTDAALGQALVANASVPLKLRQAVNVESGLNDGLALPVVLIAAYGAAATAQGGGHGADGLLPLAVRQIVLGPLTGVAIAFTAAKIMDAAAGRGMMTTTYRGIFFLATAGLCFVAAELAGGNGFIAAFVGGLTFGHTLKCAHDFIDEFMESEGQLLSIFTFLIFGAVLVPAGLAHATWKTAVLALAFLTIVRMLPVWLSLTGSGLAPREKLFLGWAGPRGLASVLFVLLVLEEYAVPAADEVLACVVLTVLLSIVLHGVTAAPLAASFAARRRGATMAHGGEKNSMHGDIS